MNTYIPSNSSIYINCTTTRQDESLLWVIQRANSSQEIIYSDHTEAVLNNIGYYEVRFHDSATIQLLINGSRNDVHQTTIKCVYIRGLQAPTLHYETILVVYGKCSVSRVVMTII